jgi:pimeloyl-ACP methyl ester carboxylesterase
VTPPVGWLLLRGLAREQRHWGPFPGVLGAALGAPIACLDLPGFGSEHERASPASVGRITDDLRGRFAQTRGDTRWSVLGISLGGMVALDWCARFPGDFERCVVVNASTRLSRRGQRLRARTLVELAPAVFGQPLDRARAVLRISSNASPTDREALARLHARWLAERPLAVSNVLRQVLAASRFELPPHVETPCLVMSSTGDRMVSWRCSETIARALGAPLALHRSAGHDLTLDAPDWVTAQVSRWT